MGLAASPIKLLMIPVYVKLTELHLKLNLSIHLSQIFAYHYNCGSPSPIFREVGQPNVLPHSALSDL